MKHALGGFQQSPYYYTGGEFFVTTVPEPGSLGLITSGLVALMGAALRRRR
jgi:hypothetical protein